MDCHVPLDFSDTKHGKDIELFPDKLEGSNVMNQEEHGNPSISACCYRCCRSNRKYVSYNGISNKDSNNDFDNNNDNRYNDSNNNNNDNINNDNINDDYINNDNNNNDNDNSDDNNSDNRNKDMKIIGAARMKFGICFTV